jgi:hypothetical protein
LNRCCAREIPGRILLRRKLSIPEPVRKAIEAHVRERVSEAEHRFYSAAEDEDTLTGHLGALLGAGERKVEVEGRIWYWSIEYTKFRGRGNDATESKIGADGIFEIRLHGVEVEGQKSILFQSKMGKPNGGQAREQALVMSNWREASIFLSYEPKSISVFSLDAVLNGNPTRGQPFSDFFIDQYLACHVGDSDLTYDAKARILHWRDENGDRIAVKFRIPQRLRVDVHSPFTPFSSTKVISSDKIHQHRMDSNFEERLGLDGNFSLSDLKRARKSIARLYHPDSSPSLTEELKTVMNRRMAEFNDAYVAIQNKKNWSS